MGAKIPKSQRISDESKISYWKDENQFTTAYFIRKSEKKKHWGIENMPFSWQFVEIF